MFTLAIGGRGAVDCIKHSEIWWCTSDSSSDYIRLRWLVEKLLQHKYSPLVGIGNSTVVFASVVGGI